MKFELVIGLTSSDAIHELHLCTFDTDYIFKFKCDPAYYVTCAKRNRISLEIHQAGTFIIDDVDLSNII